jgi:hypothetical protein
VWPYFLKCNYEAFDAFKKWNIMIEKQTDKKIKIASYWQWYGNFSNEFNDYYTDEGIVKHHTIPYTSTQNGVTEHMNITVISMAYCMLSNTGMNKHFWTEAASTACYLINRLPCPSLDKKTPIEVWSGAPVDYS